MNVLESLFSPVRAVGKRVYDLVSPRNQPGNDSQSGASANSPVVVADSPDPRDPRAAQKARSPRRNAHSAVSLHSLSCQEALDPLVVHGVDDDDSGGGGDPLLSDGSSPLKKTRRGPARPRQFTAPRHTAASAKKWASSARFIAPAAPATASGTRRNPVPSLVVKKKREAKSNRYKRTLKQPRASPRDLQGRKIQELQAFNTYKAQVLSFNSQSKRDYLGDSSLDTSYAGNRPSGSFRSSFAPNQSVRGGHPGLSFSFNAFTVPKLKQRPNTNKRHAAAAVNISTAARPAKRPVYATVIRPGNSTPRIASARSSSVSVYANSSFLTEMGNAGSSAVTASTPALGVTKPSRQSPFGTPASAGTMATRTGRSPSVSSPALQRLAAQFAQPEVSPISADADNAMPLSPPVAGGSQAAADREEALAEGIEELEIGSEAWFQSWRNKTDPNSNEYKAEIKQLTEDAERLKLDRLAIEEAKAETRREEQKKIDDMRRIAEAQKAPAVVVDQNLLALDGDATAMVDEFWDESLDDNELFCSLKKKTIEIKRCDMLTLKGLNWLNDNVINGYLSLLVERSKAGQGAPPRLPKVLPKVWAPSTFFYSKLKDVGYSAVQRWTRSNKCPGGIFSHDIMIVPVHLKMHWACGFLDFRSKTIELYDSLGISETIFFKIMRDYIVAEAKDKGVAGVDIDEWTDVRGDACPKQNNGSDCGMFATKFADYRSRDLALDFGQRNMQYFRCRTAWEIFQGKCLA